MNRRIRFGFFARAATSDEGNTVFLMAQVQQAARTNYVPGVGRLPTEAKNSVSEQGTYEPRTYGGC
jgi:hypothetical protein